MCVCFFFNDTATTEIYTLSLHDALPIYRQGLRPVPAVHGAVLPAHADRQRDGQPDAQRMGLPDHLLDRKSTRLNSSHANISYAVFCLKKKTTKTFEFK